KLGHFARECRAPRSKEGQFRNQDNTKLQGNNEDTYLKAMLAIDGVGFDWSDMVEEQVQTNMALMAFSDSKNEVLFSEEVTVLKREVACKDYEINVRGLGYSAVPLPHPLIYNRPKKLDLSYSGLDEFKEPKFKGYDPENKEQVSQDTSSFVESSLNVDKETIFPVDKKVELAKPKNHEKPVKRSVRNMSPRAVLLKTSLTPLNTVRPVNTAH
ncbi:hypothetical protein Tco_0028328, partial [Tanacetum coccineum]